MSSHKLFAFVLSLSLAACGDDPPSKTAREIPKPAPSTLAAPGFVPAPAPTPVVPTPAPVVPAPAPAVTPDPSTVAPAEPAVDDVAALEAEIETSPDDAKLRVELARLYISSNQAKKARKQAERATQLDPKSSAAWNTLGRVELLDRDDDAAAEDFENATELDAKNVYAWNNLGLALGLGEHWEESAAALEKAIALDDAQPYMWNNLGNAYEHLDRLEDARDAYHVAAKAGSPSAKANLERLDKDAMPDDQPDTDDTDAGAPSPDAK